VLNVDRSTVKHLFKIFKTIGTGGFLTALECTKFAFSWGSAPHPAGGTYSSPPDPLADLRGTYSKGKGREGGKRRGGSAREGERRGKEREGEATAPSYANSWIRRCKL